MITFIHCIIDITRLNAITDTNQFRHFSFQFLLKPCIGYGTAGKDNCFRLNLLSYTFFINFQMVPLAQWGQFLPIYLFLLIDLARRLKQLNLALTF